MKGLINVKQTEAVREKESETQTLLSGPSKTSDSEEDERSLTRGKIRDKEGIISVRKK